MGKIRQRLTKLGIELPVVPNPVGNFKSGIIQNDLLFLSGQGPLLSDGNLATGKVGVEVSVKEAYEHSRRVGMVLVATMENLLGDLDRVKQVIKLFGMVNADPDFTEHPKVINGCSDLMVEIFKEKGYHARSAVGFGSLPSNITVEIEAIVAIEPT